MLSEQGLTEIETRLQTNGLGSELALDLRDVLVHIRELQQPPTASEVERARRLVRRVEDTYGVGLAGDLAIRVAAYGTERRTALAGQLIKAVEAIAIDSRFSGHYLNGFGIAKADAITAIRAECARLGVKIGEGDG